MLLRIKNLPDPCEESVTGTDRIFGWGCRWRLPDPWLTVHWLGGPKKCGVLWLGACEEEDFRAELWVHGVAYHLETRQAVMCPERWEDDCVLSTTGRRTSWDIDNTYHNASYSSSRTNITVTFRWRHTKQCHPHHTKGTASRILHQALPYGDAFLYGYILRPTNETKPWHWLRSYYVLA